MYLGSYTLLRIMTDLYPRFANEKVDLAVALAPVARLSNMLSPLKFLIPMSTHIEVINSTRNSRRTL